MLNLFFFFYHPFHLISDIDECVAGTHNCSKDTVCKNTKGGFKCECKAGFTEDGHNCTGKGCMMCLFVGWNYVPYFRL